MTLVSVPSLPPELERAFAALESVDSPAEAGDVQAMFESLRVLAKKAGLSLEVQNRAAEGKLRAERRGGELLASLPKKLNQHDASDTLSQAGIERHQSSRWQRIASIPADDFEAYIAEAFQKTRELTTSGALQLARVRAPQPAPRKKAPGLTTAVAVALHKLAEAAEAFDVIDQRKLADYVSEVPVWSGNLAESMKAIQSFNDALTEVST